MTTLMFSRRALQVCLHELRPVLSSEQYNVLVTNLDRSGPNRVAAAWETVLLHALSRITPFEFEAALPNGKKPDFTLNYVYGGVGIAIVGDITSVSDKGLDEKNPVDVLVSAIVKLAEKCGLDPSKLNTQIEGRTQGAYRDARMVLALPPRKQIAELVVTHVGPFLRSIHKDTSAEMTFSLPDAKFTVRYDPSQRYLLSGHPSYDVPYSRRKHPIAATLKDKRDQLCDAPEDVIRTILLCDGGCRAMSAAPNANGSTFTAADIVRNFLRQTTNVDVVVLISIERRDPFDHRSKDYGLRYEIAISPNARRSPRVTANAVAAVKDLVERLMQLLPAPVLDAANAAIRCNYAGYTLGFHGGYTVTDHTIRLSSRQVQEVLAGQKSPEEFQASLGWNRNPFARALNDGRIIAAVKVIDGGDGDDDWLEFTLGEANPAISRFT